MGLGLTSTDWRHHFFPFLFCLLQKAPVTNHLQVNFRVITIARPAPLLSPRVITTVGIKPAPLPSLSGVTTAGPNTLCLKHQISEHNCPLPLGMHNHPIMTPYTKAREINEQTSVSLFYDMYKQEFLAKSAIRNPKCCHMANICRT